MINDFSEAWFYASASYSGLPFCNFDDYYEPKFSKICYFMHILGYNNTGMRHLSNVSSAFKTMRMFKVCHSNFWQLTVTVTLMWFFYRILLHGITTKWGLREHVHNKFLVRCGSKTNRWFDNLVCSDHLQTSWSSTWRTNKYVKQR